MSFDISHVKYSLITTNAVKEAIRNHDLEKVDEILKDLSVNINFPQCLGFALGRREIEIYDRLATDPRCTESQEKVFPPLMRVLGSSAKLGKGEIVQKIFGSPLFEDEKQVLNAFSRVMGLASAKDHYHLLQTLVEAPMFDQLSKNELRSLEIILQCRYDKIIGERDRRIAIVNQQIQPPVLIENPLEFARETVVLHDLGNGNRKIWEIFWARLDLQELPDVRAQNREGCAQRICQLFKKYCQRKDE